jgi:hypothetical protein
MAFYKEHTTSDGVSTSYWDIGIIDFQFGAPEHVNQSASVQMWGWHDFTYFEQGAPPVDKKAYSNNYASGTDYYPYNTFNLTGISGEVTGIESVRSVPLPSGWSWTDSSVSGWMNATNDTRNGAQTWMSVCVPDFSGAVITGTPYPD